ncbi:large subunit ribosomal protein L4 [Paenibacillus rhizosphaerae]|uniref:Large ribosomal subunit protein uL4 n=1 Tax=Paenibacillus rhizosphaerae TaxID=297318 RepID=A0A839TPR6_9BACL|nr:50S ribosomal protein L4 [Paenibacillus rhizosphaerae]MBB3128816.1 large subunit ribosomal protein L4 [Paenibacillus rhizosphaerae]
MLKISVYDMDGRVTGEMELEQSIFGMIPNESVLHEAVVHYLANKRSGTHSTLTRGEVRGGGRKPYKQNKINRSRAGSIRMPHWRHGGIAFGPKPRDYGYRLNKKVKRLAIKSALSAKVQDNKFIVVDSIQLESYRTKSIVAMLNALDANRKALIVLPEKDHMVYKSANNIPGVQTTEADSLNAYDILNCDTFIITKDAISMVTEIYI